MTWRNWFYYFVALLNAFGCGCALANSKPWLGGFTATTTVSMLSLWMDDRGGKGRGVVDA